MGHPTSFIKTEVGCLNLFYEIVFSSSFYEGLTPGGRKPVGKVRGAKLLEEVRATVFQPDKF